MRGYYNYLLHRRAGIIGLGSRLPSPYTNKNSVDTIIKHQNWPCPEMLYSFHSDRSMFVFWNGQQLSLGRYGESPAKLLPSVLKGLGQQFTRARFFEGWLN